MKTEIRTDSDVSLFASILSKEQYVHEQRAARQSLCHTGPRR